MSEPVYLGIDLGTQSVRVLAVTAGGDVAASAANPLRSIREGVRHEQSPQEWWLAVSEGCRKVVRDLGGAEVLGLAVCATSGTILLIDDAGGPLTNGLMYDDARAQAEAAAVNDAGEELWLRMSYRMQPSWALPKLLWLARAGAVRSGVRVAHQNDYINMRLSGSLVATDSSHALKTGYDLIENHWPGKILDRLNLPSDIFPSVVRPGTKIGEVCEAAAGETGIAKGTPIYAGMTDGCAAQIASGAIAEGSWNSVIGTTLVMKGVTGALLHDPAGVVYSHRSPDGRWLPGGASNCGAGLIAKQFMPEEMESLNRAALRADPTGVVVYPLMGTGERYPFSESRAHGFTVGQARSREEQYTATLEGIACVERLAVDALRMLGAPMYGAYTISGGATRSDALNSIRAAMLQRTLHVPSVTESAFGMAVLAASSGSSLQGAAESMVRVERTVEPAYGFERYANQYARFVSELQGRGWLDGALAGAALQGASA
ncbi:MAG: carbohydrate kinase [Acidobacteria bacterium]|nr:carbohydrate kinase [Acidobacteriota bacterium]